jgi:hypothetical protein
MSYLVWIGRLVLTNSVAKPMLMASTFLKTRQLKSTACVFSPARCGQISVCTDQSCKRHGWVRWRYACRTSPRSAIQAGCEGFFERLKTELFYPRNWQDTSIDQFSQIVDSYIRWYNEKRIKISLGTLSPTEYRASLGIAA